MPSMNAKDFTKYVEEQVPSRLKTNTYLVFLGLVKKRNITTTEELQAYLNRRKDMLSDFLKTGRTSSTMTDQLREKTQELEFIKHMERNFLKYL